MKSGCLKAFILVIQQLAKALMQSRYSGSVWLNGGGHRHGGSVLWWFRGARGPQTFTEGFMKEEVLQPMENFTDGYSSGDRPGFPS